MKSLEHDLQVVLCKYMDLKKIPYFSIPNGGKRNLITAKKLKAEGVKAGVSDLFIYLPASGYHGLFVEVKYGKNKQQQSQIEFQSKVEKNGYKYILVYSLEDLINGINNYVSAK